MGHKIFTLTGFLWIAFLCFTTLPSFAKDEVIPAGEKILKKEAPKKFLRDLKKIAKEEKTAEEALNIYEELQDIYELSDLQKKEYATQLKHWKQLVKKDYVRNGKKWIPRNEYENLQKEADKLVNQALELAKVGSWKFAEKKFKSASKLDRNAVRSDFILGILNSPLVLVDLKKTARHYREVLRREPNHISALNNLALVEVRLGNYSSALRYWGQAVEISPKVPEVTHNLGKLINEASFKTVYVKSSVLERYSSLYSDAIVSGQGTKADLKKGWLHMPLVLPRKEEERVTVIDDKISKLIALGSGSGFVIAPNMILTNKHVVKNDSFGIASEVTIIDPEDPEYKRELKATIFAISKKQDLAILKCEQLKAPPIALAKSLPRRASDMMILGYPKQFTFGRSLKTTRGSVTALPLKSGVNRRLVFDAEANGGNSGGPVCDSKGNCIGILTEITNVHIGDYSLAIPSNDISFFIKETIPDFHFQDESNQELDWPDVDEKVSPSTVLVLTYTKNSSLGFIPKRTISKKTSDFLEENLCLSCDGSKRADCPDCSSGKVTIKIPFKVTIGRGDLTQTITKYRPKRVRCNTCLGKGSLKCRHCR